MLVWIEAWQHDCCGEAFEIGSTVTWQVGRHPAPESVWRRAGVVAAERFRHERDMHSQNDEATPLEAVVRRIRLVSFTTWGAPEPTVTDIALAKKAQHVTKDPLVGILVDLDVLPD